MNDRLTTGGKDVSRVQTPYYVRYPPFERATNAQPWQYIRTQPSPSEPEMYETETLQGPMRPVNWRANRTGRLSGQYPWVGRACQSVE